MQDTTEEQILTLAHTLLTAEEGNYPRALKAACRLAIKHRAVSQELDDELREKTERLRRLDIFMEAFKALLEDGEKS